MGTAAIMLATGTAQAASWGTTNLTSWTSKGNVKVGTAKFTANGDKLTVCDRRADGYSPAVRVFRHSDFKLVWTVRATHGNGTCTTASKNLGESTKYEFWADTDPYGDYVIKITTAGAS
ncbi:hypothetical protein [Streptomyces mexicanus]|uniref:Secreted protein n=1 Tax=Streptomyces mexicanus TaxID=178566 RepID=A0A7X1LUE9_9ACTN|nr:hypothetical protein [Streptomyces mexicanus]MBC2869799.1 hypothetical protein [Streptomyces mexicanus]